MWDGGHEEHLREEGLEGEHSSMQQSEVSGGSDLSPEDLPLQALVSPQKAGMCSTPMKEVAVARKMEEKWRQGLVKSCQGPRGP